MLESEVGVGFLKLLESESVFQNCWSRSQESESNPKKSSYSTTLLLNCFVGFLLHFRTKHRFITKKHIFIVNDFFPIFFPDFTDFKSLLFLFQLLLFLFQLLAFKGISWSFQCFLDHFQSKLFYNFSDFSSCFFLRFFVLGGRGPRRPSPPWNPRFPTGPSLL